MLGKEPEPEIKWTLFPRSSKVATVIHNLITPMPFHSSSWLCEASESECKYTGNRYYQDSCRYMDKIETSDVAQETNSENTLKDPHLGLSTCANNIWNRVVSAYSMQLYLIMKSNFLMRHQDSRGIWKQNLSTIWNPVWNGTY